MTRAAIAAATTLAGTAALIAWLRRHFVVIDVDGPSMQPTLDSGDRVLVRRRPLRHIRTGDIVVVGPTEHRRPSGHPVANARRTRNLSDHTWMIKRAAAVPGDPVPESVAAAVSAATDTRVPDGRLIVLGDNATRSVDSRKYGYLSGDGVLGVVVRHLQPPGRNVHRVGARPVGRVTLRSGRRPRISASAPTPHHTGPVPP